MGSKLFKSNEDYVSIRPVLQPVIFERKEKDIPNLLVFYTQYKEDSTLSEILYEWDVSNFEKGDNVKKSLAFNKAMVKKYQDIITEISKKYGKSVQNGNLENLKNLILEEGVNREDEWSINDSLKINSYITLSEYYNKNGMVTIAPTHRIRVYVNNKRSEKVKDLSKENIELYNDFFSKFINTLKQSDFDTVKNMLSDKIKDTATNDDLKKLLENNHFERKREIFMTGYQLLGDGEHYPMLQYKYSDDNSDPPKEIIVVLFDNEGKILGVKPMKMF
ncbi:hypothetical protein [Chryseobacterium sp. 3008163]|uniref:hypothetical protein n=1 Tax=Chryseobacterium sp. 3008163 TaxID=2478663 RepID=UPI000F0CCC47|nr:hypothetical protein [Chryseobacterium sp. 3008163]AYN02356.1 hypothetical protein EAG08_20430 [Chryseobacterium sp. 3008163]